MKSVKLFSFVAIASLSLFALAACGDSEAKTPPPATPTTGVPVVPTPDPGSNPTDVEAINKAIKAVLAGDSNALRQLLKFGLVACTTQEGEGAGGPPICKPDEGDGTLVSVIPMSQCEGYYALADETSMSIFAEHTSTLYAVYRTSANFYPAGDYAVIFEQDRGQQGVWAVELVMDDESVTGINFGCAQTGAEMVSLQRLTDAIVAPEAP